MMTTTVTQKPAKLPHPVHGWRPTDLAANLSQAQLIELMRAVESDPVSKNPRHSTHGSIFLYTKAAQKKLDALSWAVTHQLRDAKSST
jgi:hypothetical protein